jgi:hypothetical protein
VLNPSLFFELAMWQSETGEAGQSAALCSAAEKAVSALNGVADANY